MKSNNILDTLSVIVKQRKVIIGLTSVAAVAAIIYSLVTPQIWNSTAAFLAVGDNTTGLPIDLGNISSLASSFIGTGNATEGLNNITVMTSRTFSEDIIRRYGLIKYFKINEPDSNKAMDIALLKFKKRVASIGLDEETGLTKVSIKTKSKQLSLDIAQHYIQKLEYYNQELKQTKGKRNRQFLEKRVAEIKHEIDSLSVALKDFQKSNKAIDLETQLTATVKIYSDVISQQMLNEIELEMAKNNFSSTSPIVKELEQKKNLILKQIKELEQKAGTVKPKYMLDIDKIPDLSLKYAQLMINLEIQKKLFEYIYPQYELAKLEELKDMPTLEVIDYPRLAGMRARPKRALICIIATFLGFILSLLVAFIKNFIDLNRERVTHLWRTLWGKKTDIKSD